MALAGYAENQGLSGGKKRAMIRKNVVLEFNTANNTYNAWVDNGALGNKNNWNQYVETVVSKIFKTGYN
jgi:hypothetical protein